MKINQSQNNIIKVIFANTLSAMKISKILSDHSNDKILKADEVICGLIYRLMNPMSNDEISQSLSEADNIMYPSSSSSDEEGFEISMIIHDAVLIHMKRKGSAKNIKKLKTIMSDAAEKVIGAAIPVDTNIIRKQFNQDGEHKERWEKLYEKLEWTKNKQVSNSDIVYSKQPPVVFNKYI